MSNKNSAKQPTRKNHQSLDNLDSTSPLSSRTRWLLSAVVVLQLLAVVAEPFRFFTRSSRGSSPAADPARNLLGPWIEFGYLNHGYFFFAPEPGPSHLIECRLSLPDGEQATLRYPDREAQWPRLLYHRHFMMTENLHQLWVPPVDPALAPDLEPGLLGDWQADRNRFAMIRDSMTNHIAERFQARSVELNRIEHRLPSDDEVFRQRIRLNDRRLYITLPDAPPSADLEAPAGMSTPWTQPRMGADEAIPRINSPLSLPPPSEATQ